MKPSLLYLEKDKEISSYVFKDLNLVSVFNDQIIEILSYPWYFSYSFNLCFYSIIFGGYFQGKVRILYYKVRIL